jgi:16S rRNA (cytosine967-C5)-methyltransferase
MAMSEEMDAGDVFLQRETPIAPDETAGSLAERLARLGAQAIGEALDGIRAGTLRAVAQPAAGITFAPRIEREHCALDWTRPAVELERQVRGLAPAAVRVHDARRTAPEGAPRRARRRRGRRRSGERRPGRSRGHRGRDRRRGPPSPRSPARRPAPPRRRGLPRRASARAGHVPRRRIAGGAEPRAIAQSVLLRVEATDAFADVLLADRLAGATLAAADHALATRLVYGTLAWQGRLDHHLRGLVRTPLDRLDPPVRIALRLGLYQLLFLDRVPAYAAVDASVRLARAAGRGAAGLVNAVLRRAASDPGALGLPDPGADPLGRLAVEWSHPRWLVERWSTEVGLDDLPRLLAANNERAATAMRANRLRTTPEALRDALAAAGARATRSRWAPDGLVVEQAAARLRGTPAWDAGHFAFQSEASQLIAPLLGVSPGARILDACSAPGGKAAHVAALLGGSGLVAALDRRAAGARRAAAEAGRLGADVVLVAAGDARRPPFARLFDAVLVDAPCSGLGNARAPSRASLAPARGGRPAARDAAAGDPGRRGAARAARRRPRLRRVHDHARRERRRGRALPLGPLAVRRGGRRRVGFTRARHAGRHAAHPAPPPRPRRLLRGPAASGFVGAAGLAGLLKNCACAVFQGPARPARVASIAPSILSADFGRLADEVRAVTGRGRRPDSRRRDGRPFRAADHDRPARRRGDPARDPPAARRPPHDRGPRRSR